MTMDKWQALDTYWNSFGVPAYNELTVPEDAQMPYITYEAAIGSLNGPMTLSASLYWKGNSWAWGMKRVTDMQKVMDRQIKIDGGYVMFRVPVASSAQPTTDAFDEQVRRIIMPIEVEFLSN